MRSCETGRTSSLQEIKLSILIPSIPSRVTKFLMPLYEKLKTQCLKYPEVEILIFLDNKTRTIGKKREGLVKLAQGEYQVQIDDDDNVTPDFVSSLMEVIKTDKPYDVILFDQYASINGENLFTVQVEMNNENEQCKKINGVWVNIKRAPFHNMCWRSSIAKSEDFPDASYGEDWHWAKRLNEKVKTHYKINKALTFYYFNEHVTEAEHIFPKE